jgi:ATP-dependent Clp protease, protease subunit
MLFSKEIWGMIKKRKTVVMRPTGDGGFTVCTSPTPAQQNGVCFDRLIYLSGLLNEDSSRDVIEKLLDYQRKDPLLEITFILDCYGGEVDSMFAVVDMMKIVMSPIRTICVGKAMSAAALIFACGQKGRRFMTANSRLMFHQMSGWHSGPVTDVVIDVEEIKFMQDQMIQRLVEVSNMNADDIRVLIDRNTYLRPEKAIELGICDGIIDRFSV